MSAKPKLFNLRHRESTLLYQTVAGRYQTWLELASVGPFDGQGDHHSPKPYVRQAFAKYLRCGIFAHGFASARCDDGGNDFLVEAAAHLRDHVFERLPVRQCVLSVPKCPLVRAPIPRGHGAAAIPTPS